MSNQSIMKISRCNEIKNDLDQAILWLNDLYFEAGYIIMVSYYTDIKHKKVDAVLALGLKNGKGMNCYKVISVTKPRLIWGVCYNSEDIPDISSLSHGEEYLYHDSSTDSWFIISNNNGSRVFTEISDIPQTLINLEDGTVWVSNENRRVKRLNDISDFYSREEIDRKIEYARNNPRYVEFENLTTEQKEQLKGEKGDTGSIDNFVVLSQAEYDALGDDIDPYKFYFIYEGGDFYAYVLNCILYISAEEDSGILDIDPQYARWEDNILILPEIYPPTPPGPEPDPAIVENNTLSNLNATVDQNSIYLEDPATVNNNSLYV